MDCGGICPYDPTFKVDCHDFINTPRNSGNFVLIRRLNGGYFSETFIGMIEGQFKIIKYLDLNLMFIDSSDNIITLGERQRIINVIFNNEVCNQNRASKFGLSPRIMVYWMCKTYNKAVIIMEYIDGISLNELPEYQDYKGLYLRCIRKVLELNLNAGILHGDLHLENIMLSDDIYIIDFGKSQEYNGGALDLVDFTFSYISRYPDPDVKDIILKYDLCNGSSWDNILTSFSSIDEIIEFISK